MDKGNGGKVETTIQAFKGFDKDMKCRDFQFEVGKTYKHDGNVQLCSSGFHAVEFPLDAWRYYSPSKGSVFSEVALHGVTEEIEKDSKRVGSSITIGARLSILEMVKAHVKIVVTKADKKSLATGYSGHAAATGDSGHAAATGYSGHAAATGDYGHAAATGDSGHAAATCNYGHAAATGNSGHAAATGNYGHAAATGYYGASFAGFNGKAKAAAKGAFAVAWYDQKADRARLIVGTPGENGIKADTWYEVKDGKLKEAE